jgi:hypothetical protein
MQQAALLQAVQRKRLDPQRLRGLDPAQGKFWDSAVLAAAIVHA